MKSWYVLITLHLQNAFSAVVEAGGPCTGYSPPAAITRLISSLQPFAYVNQHSGERSIQASADRTQFKYRLGS